MIPARTSAFYIANPGSEVARLQAALSAKDDELAQGALKRIQLIFEAVLAMPLRKSERAEIVLLRRVIEDLPAKKRRFSVDTKSLESYFYPFARKVLGI